MDLLKNFLSRYGGQVPPESIVRNVVIEEIQKHIGVTLDRKKIHLVGRSLKFDVEPAMRSVIRNIFPVIQSELKEKGIIIDSII
jgi:hypothetical protein